MTDAHLMVGNVSADRFAGGLFKLNTLRSSAVISDQIQSPLGMNSVEQAAAGIVELADETMANAARIHGIELGLDVSEFDLLVSGGGGALHGARIAEKLGIRRIIVPENAGVGSAIGFLRSAVAFESAISVVEPLHLINMSNLTRRIVAITTYVRGVVEEVVEPEQVSCVIKAELRYQGQGLEVTLPLERHGEADLVDLPNRFERRYWELTGFTLPDIPIELISISVRACEDRSDLPTRISARRGNPIHTSFRDIFEPNCREFLPHNVIDRQDMDGQRLAGPALISEPQTSTLVKPGWTVHRSTEGHLVMEQDAS